MQMQTSSFQDILWMILKLWEMVSQNADSAAESLTVPKRFQLPSTTSHISNTWSSRNDVLLFCLDLVFYKLVSVEGTDWHSSPTTIYSSDRKLQWMARDEVEMTSMNFVKGFNGPTYSDSEEEGHCSQCGVRQCGVRLTDPGSVSTL